MKLPNDPNKYVNIKETGFNKYGFKFNFSGINFLCTSHNIEYLKRINNNFLINIFEYEKCIYPITIVDYENEFFNSLLYIIDNWTDIAHFVYIKDFDSVICPQLTKNHHAIITCNIV